MNQEKVPTIISVLDLTFLLFLTAGTHNFFTICVKFGIEQGNFCEEMFSFFDWVLSIDVKFFDGESPSDGNPIGVILKYHFPVLNFLSYVFFLNCITVITN